MKKIILIISVILFSLINIFLIYKLISKPIIYRVRGFDDNVLITKGIYFKTNNDLFFFLKFNNEYSKIELYNKDTLIYATNTNYIYLDDIDLYGNYLNDDLYLKLSNENDTKVVNLELEKDFQNRFQKEKYDKLYQNLEKVKEQVLSKFTYQNNSYVYNNLTKDKEENLIYFSDIDNLILMIRNNNEVINYTYSYYSHLLNYSYSSKDKNITCIVDNRYKDKCEDTKKIEKNFLKEIKNLLN